MVLNDYRTAVVTGASSGIGAATVQALCDRGLEVHAIARREERLSSVAKATGCKTHVLDVRETDTLSELLESLDIDVLVNNAGVGRAIQSLSDANAADVDQTIDTNVAAALHAARAVLPAMINRGSGHVINIGSVAGLYPLASAVYGASKGAIHFLSTNLRQELVGTGIRVTEICPGRVRTEFYDAAVDDPVRSAELKETGIHEITSVDVADAIIYALTAPWHVNVARIELQPTEQTYGGMQFTPRGER